LAIISTGCRSQSTPENAVNNLTPTVYSAVPEFWPAQALVIASKTDPVVESRDVPYFKSLYAELGNFYDLLLSNANDVDFYMFVSEAKVSEEFSQSSANQ